MNGNNEDDYDEDWVDDSEPVYRSLCLANPTFGAPPFGDGGRFTESQSSMMTDSMQTYDGDEEEPVYRSLAVAAPPNPHGAFGGFGTMGHMHDMGPHMGLQQKPAPVFQSIQYPSVTLSPVPISVCFLDHCHVYATGNKDMIAFKVSEVLKQYGVDFVFKDKKSKWKCAHYDCVQHMDFRVRLYMSVDNTEVFPLEFQRRQGPLLQFNQMYQSVLFALSQAGILRDPVRQPSKPLPLPSLPMVPTQDIDNGVGSLVEMAQSAREDTKHQALVSLSKISPKPEYQKSLLRHAAAVQTFRSCLLATGSPHVRRCAATVLADLCETHAGQTTVAAGLALAQDGSQETLQRLFELVDAPSDMETRRQSCRLLARLASHCHGAITAAAVGNPSATQLLVTCDSQSDPRLKKHLGEMREALRAQGVSL